LIQIGPANGNRFGKENEAHLLGKQTKQAVRSKQPIATDAVHPHKNASYTPYSQVPLNCRRVVKIVRFVSQHLKTIRKWCLKT
jgi:hypothetical protein